MNMRKGLIVLVKVFLIITLLFIGLYYAYKSMTKNNLDDKLNSLNVNWTELLKLQDEKNNLLGVLVKNSSPNIQFTDSLNLSLIEYTKNRKSIIFITNLSLVWTALVHSSKCPSFFFVNLGHHLKFALSWPVF